MTLARERALASALRWGLIALVVLMAGVYFTAYFAKRDTVGQLRAGCARGLFDKADSAQADADLASFAGDAATARRADGNPVTASRYEGIMLRALRRQSRRETRLLGVEASLLVSVDKRGRPVTAAVVAADRACARTFAQASPWPWNW